MVQNKFHVNPKTGNPGVCRAKANCPFGGDDEHFESREEARSVYEKTQEKFEHFNWKSKMPATKGTYITATYDPMSEEVAVGELWGNKVFAKFAEQMDSAAPGTRLVIENGQVWEKTDLYGPEVWKFTSGDYDPLTRVEKGRAYDRSYIGSSILRHGGRLEQGGTAPKMDLKHRAHIYPDDNETLEEADRIAKRFNHRAGAATPEDLSADLDDYITERWHELNPMQWRTIGERLRYRLGEPKDLGRPGKPAWVWERGAS